MPGLLRGVARTAVIAGTATHVSNNVSRRQQNRWADQSASPQQQEAPAPETAVDPYIEIEKLGQLKSDGLITRSSVQQRWATTVALLVSTTLIWYFVRRNTRTESYYRVLTYCLITVDILFAAYFIYLDRGMASRNVVLFGVPLATAALLNSRAALFATAALCTAAYVFAATKYFYDYFNEGYKAELYGVLFLYSACMFVVAAILWAIIRYQKLS